MIDLHCHILPGINDGAKTMDDSLAMAHAAVAEGITHILATLHYKNRRWDNKKIGIISDVENFLNNRNIPLSVFSG